MKLFAVTHPDTEARRGDPFYFVPPLKVWLVLGLVLLTGIVLKPGIVLGGIAGLCYIALLVIDFRVGLLAIVLAAPFSLSLPASTSLRIMLLSALLAFSVYRLLKLKVQFTIVSVPRAITLFVLLYLWFCCIATFFSPDKASSARYLVYESAIVVTNLVFIMVLHQERWSWWLIRVIFIAGVAVALYTLWQQVVGMTRDPFYVLFQGKEESLFTGSSLYKAARVRGPFTNPNTLSAYLTMVLPLGISCQAMTHKRLEKVLITGGIGLITMAVLFSFSRAGLLAVAAMMLFLLALTRGAIIKYLLILVPLVAVLLGLFAGEGFWEKVFLRFFLLSGRMGPHDSSALSRLVLWQTAITMIIKSPLWGYGFNTFKAMTAPIMPFGIQFDAAHNSYLQRTFELGVIGSGIFYGFLVYLWSKLWRAYRVASSNDYKMVILGLLTSWIGFAVGGMFDSVFHDQRFYMNFWSIIAASCIVVLQGTRPQLPAQGTNAVSP